MKTISAKVFRTEMCGGGTTYDVYLPLNAKQYRPIAGHIYATEIHRDNGQYYTVDDFIRTPEIDNLPALTSERSEAFKRLRKVSDRLAFKIACRAFPELRQLKRMPLLWTEWTLPSATKTVKIHLRDKYSA